MLYQRYGISVDSKQHNFNSDHQLVPNPSTNPVQQGSTSVDQRESVFFGPLFNFCDLYLSNYSKCFKKNYMVL